MSERDGWDEATYRYRHGEHTCTEGAHRSAAPLNAYDIANRIRLALSDLDNANNSSDPRPSDVGYCDLLRISRRSGVPALHIEGMAGEDFIVTVASSEKAPK